MHICPTEMINVSFVRNNHLFYDDSKQNDVGLRKTLLLICL